MVRLISIYLIFIIIQLIYSCVFHTYSFLGGAGTGKSFTIKAIAKYAEKILRMPGDHPNHPKVILLAPTGKAANLIGKYSLLS